jgi:hypothetical protein
MPYVEDGLDGNPQPPSRNRSRAVLCVLNLLLYAAWFGLGYWWGHDSRPARQAYVRSSTRYRCAPDISYQLMVEAYARHYARQEAANEARAQRKTDPPATTR